MAHTNREFFGYISDRESVLLRLAVISNIFEGESREQLRQEGKRIKERAAHLERLNEAVEYGRMLIAKYGAETLGELPPDEQIEFARLWPNATGGLNFHEN